MKIGITGGTGFIGRYFLQALSPMDEAVVLTSRSVFSDLINKPNITYICGGYCREDFYRAFSDCDCIVHLGAKRSSPENEKSLAPYLENIQAADDLFKAAQELGIGNIVSISSTAVYSQENAVPFQESANPIPLSFYGVSKRSVEELAAHYNRRYGMCIKSLRAAQVLGLGERPNYMPAIFLQKCLAGQKLSVYGTGTAGKEYIYVKDIVRGINCALSHPDEKGVFNLGTGILTSNLELAKQYCIVFQNAAGYELCADKPEIPSRHYMDIQKASASLGYAPAYSLEEALMDMRQILLKGGQ